MKNELDYLYDKQIDCPVCNKKYATKKVLSKYVRAHTHDSDFCSYYTSEKKQSTTLLCKCVSIMRILFV
ncbi:DUF2225 domain-containing protein [Metabacillus herbersteinensis]|uniref:DUF2225 domain-containing protein n=1 Tax=Metabacillus herbersteinensis TaxID=283816 RepID=A0ABV6GB89_9BACI